MNRNKDYYNFNKKKFSKKQIISLILLTILLLSLLSVILVGIVLGGQDAQQIRISTVAHSTAVHTLVSKEIKIYYDKEKNRIPQYSMEEIYQLDLRKASGVREEDLKKVLKLGLKGLEKDFIKAEKKYGVNCVFLVSIAALESGWGTMLFKPNNMFGFGRSGFSSKSECIDVVAKSLSQDYLSPNGGLYNGPTLKGVNRRYASSSKWYYKVGKNMVSLYSEMRRNNLNSLKAK